MIEFTRIAKTGGPLTKRISLGPDGKPISNSEQCRLVEGTAQRCTAADGAALAAIIESLQPHEALCLGRLRDDLPASATVVTQYKYRQVSGTPIYDTALIARTAQFITYQAGQPAPLVFDLDTKGMPDSVCKQLRDCGGYWKALCHVLPALADVEYIVRASTSSGLFRTDTGERLPGSNGLHVYIFVADGTDSARFLKTLHDRCWLAGLGWLMVGAGGQLLERSIVDRMVGAPERLVFEGAPILVPPLGQDTAAREPTVHAGGIVDTRASCPPLTLYEQAQLRQWHDAARRQAGTASAKARREFIDRQTAAIVQRRNIAAADARRMLEQLCDGILHPGIVLPFDDDDLAGCTVADVLTDPEKFAGTTLADPLEGAAYGRCKARVQLHDGNIPWIHSFAHGRTVYELRHDPATLRAVLAKIGDAELITAFVRLQRHAELGDAEPSRIRDELIARLKIGKREYRAREKAAAAALAGEDRKRQTDAKKRARDAEGDSRPRIPVPPPDLPHQNVIAQLDATLAASTAAEPPMRNLDGRLCMAWTRALPDMHTLTAASANAEGGLFITAPPQPLLTPLTDVETALLIERHVDYINRFGDSVRLPDLYQRAYYRQRVDPQLPMVASIATMPIVLPDGSLLSGHYLDRQWHILFRVDDSLVSQLPRTDQRTPETIAKALNFLTEEWLVDVPAEYSGKIKLLALAATILERSVLPERPCFFVTAGQRGNGKTTAVNMISVATLGHRAAAAAWSFSREEQRKALMSYLAEGVPLIVWDNIERGASIASTSIEKSLTLPTYSDRYLSTNTIGTVPATSIHCFTGNNITPKGDLTSRGLNARLYTDRPDPENRPFKHADPIGWTYANRNRILAALYTILLGNPRLTNSERGNADTRFKIWWHLVGSAFEHAVECAIDWWPGNQGPQPTLISFREQFLDSDDEDEESNALSILLMLLRDRWPGSFTAADVIAYTNNQFGDPTASAFAREFFDALDAATQKTPPREYSVRALSWRLKMLVDLTVVHGGKRWCLGCAPQNQAALFSVKLLGDAP